MELMVRSILGAAVLGLPAYVLGQRVLEGKSPRDWILALLAPCQAP